MFALKKEVEQSRKKTIASLSLPMIEILNILIKKNIGDNLYTFASHNAICFTSCNEYPFGEVIAFIEPLNESYSIFNVGLLRSPKKYILNTGPFEKIVEDIENAIQEI